MKIGKVVLEKKFLGDFNVSKNLFASELVVLQAIDFGNVIEFIIVCEKFEEVSGIDIIYPKYYRVRTGSDGKISSVENNNDVQCISILN